MTTAAHRLPLTMRTTFQDVLLVTYAIPPQALAAMLPTKIHPYVRGDQSFISIVIANMRGMRPHPLPEALGTNYYQIVYRAVVRLRMLSGQERAGVFFLRSDANDPLMSFFGNRLTEFRFHYFHTGAISLFSRQDELLTTVETLDRGGDIVLHHRDLGPAVEHPPAEGFVDVADEQQTLVQLFHAYAYDPARRVGYDLEFERGEWHMHRLGMLDGFSAFFDESPFSTARARPVSHVYIRDCAYVWKPMTAISEDELL